MSVSEWREYTVKELVDLKMLDKPLDGNHGGMHPKSSDYVTSGIPFIMANDLKDGKVDYDCCNFITEKQAKTLKKGFAKPGDVLLTHKATMGRTAIVDDSYPYIVLTPQVTYYRVLKGIDNKYLKYYFDSKDFQELLFNWAGTGSTRAYLGITEQLKLPIILPPLPEQKAIAATLSALDDMIGLNNQINKTLEEMAQAIFKSWFVDFEPFKDEEFEESELGLIPKGWRVGKLDDVLSEIETGNRPKGGVAGVESGIPSIGAENVLGLGKYDYSKEKYVSEEFYNSMKKGKLKDWDVLLYKDGAQLGRKTMFALGFPHKKCCVNSHVFILRSNSRMNQCYLYFWLDQDYMTQKIIGLNANSAQPGINQPAVKGLPILIPPIDVLERFDDLVVPIIKNLFSNCLENNILVSIRDTLLPKLMSGEIRVPVDEVM